MRRFANFDLRVIEYSFDLLACGCHTNQAWRKKFVQVSGDFAGNREPQRSFFAREALGVVNRGFVGWISDGEHQAVGLPCHGADQTFTQKLRAHRRRRSRINLHRF